MQILATFFTAVIIWLSGVPVAAQSAYPDRPVASLLLSRLVVPPISPRELLPRSSARHGASRSQSRISPALVVSSGLIGSLKLLPMATLWAGSLMAP
jgi:hypothetical protein